MKYVALIDADVLAYQAASQAEKEIHWGDDMWTLHSFESDVLNYFEDKIKELLEKVDAEKYILAFSSPNNFRNTILPTYKNTRIGKRKPMLLQWIKARAIENHPTYLIPTLEGDDCLGILATLDLEQTVICSIDKDFKTIPGRFYDFGRGTDSIITEEEADWWHMYQTLTGDITDGYKGCPGVGDVGARKVLAQTGDPWTNVVAAYVKAGLNEAAALQQARVARILRSSDYDFDKKEVILWEPKR